MKMYTKNGEEVIVTKEIEGGFLAKRVYTGYDPDKDDNDYNEEENEIYGEVIFFDELYKSAPKQKLEHEIQLLINKKNLLTKEMQQLQRDKINEQQTLSEINKFPFVSRLVDYLTGDFKFKLNLNDYSISKKESTYNSHNIKITNTKDNGWMFYTLRSEGYESHDDWPFMVFKTEEDCIEFSRERLIKRMESYKKNTYWTSDTFKTDHNKINYSNKVKEDPEYLKVYNEVLTFLLDKESKEKAKKLKEEIKSLEEKQKQLKSLELA